MREVRGAEEAVAMLAAEARADFARFLNDIPSQRRMVEPVNDRTARPHKRGRATPLGRRANGRCSLASRLSAPKLREVDAWATFVSARHRPRGPTEP